MTGFLLAIPLLAWPPGDGAAEIRGVEFDDVPRRLEIGYFYDITTERFRESMRHWIAKNVLENPLDGTLKAELPGMR